MTAVGLAARMGFEKLIGGATRDHLAANLKYMGVNGDQ
jgi:hypothetical protein